MDNISSSWESGFAAGVCSQADIIADARAKLAEFEKGEFVPRSELADAQLEIASLKRVVSIQANAIRRLAKRIKKV